MPDPSAATPSRRLPCWVRWELRLIFVGSVTMNVWSPWAEPWWLRLMFLALASECVVGFWVDRHAR